MKKTLTAITLLAGAVTGYSQGNLLFADYAQPTALEIQIFNTQASAPSGATATQVTYGGKTVTEYVGNTSVDNAPGSAVFTSPLSGTGYDAQLYGAAGSGDAISTLTALGTAAHFYTTASSVGFIKTSQSLSTIPIDGSGNATIAIAAWAATGTAGAATTLAAAQADGYAWGFSTTASIAPTTGGSPPISMPTTIDGFSLGTAVAATPEPSTIALGVMGVSTLLFRRKK